MIRRDMDFLRVTVELASPVHGPSLGAGAGECNTTPCGVAVCFLLVWSFGEISGRRYCDCATNAGANSGSPRSCAIGSKSKDFTSSRVGVLFSTSNQCLFPLPSKTAKTTKPAPATWAFHHGGTPPNRPQLDGQT